MNAQRVGLLAVVVLVACDPSYHDAPFVLPSVEVDSVVQLDSADMIGTYELWVCRGPCADAANHVVQGYVVLLGAPLDWTHAPDSVAHLLRAWDTKRANMCLGLETLSDNHRSYAGASTAETTEWMLDSTSRRVILTLFLTHHADHVAVLTKQAGSDTLHGRGRSRGYGARRMREEDVRAVRVGPPDPERCRDRVQAAWTRIHAFSDSLARARR